MRDVDEKYTVPATEFARLLGERGHTLVWGGSDKGLMKMIASQVQENGGKIVGISMEIIKDTARTNADEMIVAKDLAERKSLMQSRADVFILLPGGIGSLDEITEMLELKKHKLHSKPIVIFNIDGFYDGLRSQLERMKEEGFIERPLEEFVYFSDTAEDAINFFEKHS